MARLVWGARSDRLFETGVDRGVFYSSNGDGFAWSGLISVNETPFGGSPKSFYLDGIKYLNLVSPEEYEATITAYGAPAEFGPYDGVSEVHHGFYAQHQKRKSFGFSYRTGIGNDISGPDFGYKIHIVYNVLASPPQRNNRTINDSSSPMELSWSITARPPESSSYKRTAHYIIDSRFAYSWTVEALEDLLYGSESSSARLPSPQEIYDLFEINSILRITDNGDGSWTADTDSEGIIETIDPDSFEITWPSATYIDSDTYTIQSL